MTCNFNALLKVTKVTFMLKSENYGIHQIKVQNIVRSGERGPPVLSGNTQSCGEAKYFPQSGMRIIHALSFQLPPLHSVMTTSIH